MQKRIPHISVVIPVYCHTQDHERFLEEALRSVGGQTFRDFEVIIVDDVSPIDIAPIIEAVDGLPETRILRNVINMGHAESRNIGIRAAQADLIAFLDHDDLWLPDKLKRQVDVLEFNEDAGMIFCDMELFGANENWLKIDQSIIPERPNFCWFVSHGNYTISASAVLARKRVLFDIGLFDSRYSTCDDFDAWLKILTVSPIVHIPEKLAKYRLHAHNVNYTVDRLNDNILLTNLILRYWRTAPVIIKLKLLPRLGRKLIGRLYFSIWRFRKLRDTK